MKKRYILGILISIFFLYLVFRKINISEIKGIMFSVNIFYIILMLSLIVPVLFVRSLRWKLMSDYFKGIPIKYFFESLSVGAMSNNLLPLRTGDLVQVYFLNYKTNLSKSVILSTMIIERLCELFAMGIILVTGSFFVLLPKEISKDKIILMFLMIIVIMAVFIKSKNKIAGLIDRLFSEGKFKDRLKNAIENFYLGLSCIKNRKIMTGLIVYTAILWFLSSLGIYFCLLSVNIKLNILLGVFILSMTGLGAMIPSSPGYIGTTEFFLVLGLGIVGIEKNHALSAALVYRIISWTSLTLFGLTILIKNNLSLGQIAHLNDK